MSSEWRSVTLNDVCIKITDGAHQSPKSVERGKPMCSVKDLTEFGLDLSSARHISKGDFDKLVRQGCMPLVGDVLIAKDGNSALDTACSIDEPVDTVLLSSVAILRPNPAVLDSDFLKYYFKSQKIINYLKSNFISGAAIPRVVLKDFKKAEIRLPELDKQRAISAILRSFDEKVRLNHEINDTLEQIAQAVFKSWFIDFDPVKAKINALKDGGAEEEALFSAMQVMSNKGPDRLAQMRVQQPEHYETLRATAGLFPSSMQESELGQIPDGWDIGPLSSLAEITMGQSPKGDTYNSEGVGTPLVNGPVEFGSYHPVKMKWTTAPSKVSDRDDLVVCVRGSTTGRFVKSDGKYCLGRGVCSIRANDLQPYVDRLFQNELPTLLGFTTGSTFPSWSGPTLKTHRVLVPNKELMESFSRLFAPVDRGISSRVKESEYLADIRDALLPKLLSGELSPSGLKSQSELQGVANA